MGGGWGVRGREIELGTYWGLCTCMGVDVR
jgi:hypothetical protein